MGTVIVLHARDTGIKCRRASRTLRVSRIGTIVVMIAHGDDTPALRTFRAEGKDSTISIARTRSATCKRSQVANIFVATIR